MKGVISALTNQEITHGDIVGLYSYDNRYDGIEFFYSVQGDNITLLNTDTTNEYLLVISESARPNVNNLVFMEKELFDQLVNTSYIQIQIREVKKQFSLVKNIRELAIDKSLFSIYSALLRSTINKPNILNFNMENVTLLLHSNQDLIESYIKVCLVKLALVDPYQEEDISKIVSKYR